MEADFVLTITMKLISWFKQYYARLFVLAASVFLVYASFNLTIGLSDFVLQHQDGRTETVTLPLTRASEPAGGGYVLEGKISFGTFASKRLHFTPDDRLDNLVINGRGVDLSAVPLESRSDWANGFSLDVGEYIDKSEN